MLVAADELRVGSLLEISPDELGHVRISEKLARYLYSLIRFNPAKHGGDSYRDTKALCLRLSFSSFECCYSEE